MLSWPLLLTNSNLQFTNLEPGLTGLETGVRHAFLLFRAAASQNSGLKFTNLEPALLGSKEIGEGVVESMRSRLKP